MTVLKMLSCPVLTLMRTSFAQNRTDVAGALTWGWLDCRTCAHCRLLRGDCECGVGMCSTAVHLAQWLMSLQRVISEIARTKSKHESLFQMEIT